MGNRIAKHVFDNSTDPAVLEKSTYYILDAQGNTMNVYEHEVNAPTATFELAERHIFGSSRLGMDIEKVDLLNPAPVSYQYTHTLGKKYYELSNHLGNVLSVITDRITPLTLNNTSVSGYEVEIASSGMYSAFGVQLDGHTFTNGSQYRFGFNGMEKDDEVSGDGNSYTAAFWQYSPRIGRRWNTDPVIKVHESPYAAFANNPIWFTDPSGADTVTFNSNTTITDRKHNGNYGNTGVHTGPLVRTNATVDVKVADGPDVFFYNTNTVHNHSDGTVTKSSTSQQFDPVGGGHNGVGGKIPYAYIFSYELSDREALGSMAPPELLDYLIDKSSGWTRLKYREAKSLKSTIDLFQNLNAVTEFAYSFYIGGRLFKGITNNLSSLTSRGVTMRGINNVEKHIATMDADAANSVMIGRLRQIHAGEIEATMQDINFYQHELREMQYMKNGMSYDKAHVKALGDYGIPYKKGFEKSLYTKDALKAGDDAFRKGN